MSNPWLSVPLEDYEGHMRSPGVEQLTILADLFKRVLDRYRPESVAVLGVAGGNGLEQIDCTVTKRIVGVDINQRYLMKSTGGLARSQDSNFTAAILPNGISISLR